MISDLTHYAILSDIRKAMADACRRDDRAEYHRLGAEHRAILHAARPDIRAAWEFCTTYPKGPILKFYLIKHYGTQLSARGIDAKVLSCDEIIKHLGLQP